MGIQIVHHQSDFVHFRIVDFQQFRNLFCPVLLCPPLAGIRMPSACQRFGENKNTTGTFADIFVILPEGATRFHLKRGKNVIEQLKGFFVHTDERDFRIIGETI
jgi:hypothetical protein